ncbi:MEKHLA domain-containing protein [Patulibacter sp.]|uniref:MEKHLA domain-containing protein n=1 Tax=Patulibacter sp. TaxID=1912859 RepID=UPI0027274EE5|nr:MEKHLA domain-containing protein [Patulibacter sp.]MDO9410552.1 MEKHLA domain-containing protein [Patulibacter sp.]
MTAADGPVLTVAGPLDPTLFTLLTRSHLGLTGEPLVPDGAGPDWLYEDAPFGLLAHTEEPDPRFVYANRTAQDRFASTWDQLVGTRSRLAAEPDAQEDRDRLLAAVTRDGFFRGYRGRRIGRTGRRFWIEDVTMWNLLDEDGARVGQAARFAG